MVTWADLIKSKNNELRPIYQKLSQARKQGIKVYPEDKLIFRALDETKFSDVKVVILGQDPYHQAGQANGLAFDVPVGTKTPPSLKNILKEVRSDLGLSENLDISLEKWAQSGVLLLNSVLTVESDKPGSHSGWGWKSITDYFIETLSKQKDSLVFMLWGEHAKTKMHLIDNSKHLVLLASHPSPLSSYRGFFGCKHFSKANDWLISKKQSPVDWY